MDRKYCILTYILLYLNEFNFKYNNLNLIKIALLNLNINSKTFFLENYKYLLFFEKT